MQAFVPTLLTVGLLLCFSGPTWAQDQCTLCQFVVQFIDGYLQANYTQQQIVKQLEVVCSLAPEPYQAQCDTFVEHYVPVLISLILKYEDPENACKQLGFCRQPGGVPDNMEDFPKVVIR